MKRTKAQRMLAAACGPALGVLLAVPVGGLIAGAAGADTDLLHGLHDADNRHHPVSHRPAPTSAPAVTDGATTAASTTSSSGLAFTGADIEEMAIIGVVAIGVGAVLVRGRRRTA